jgi:hypothetical protein
LPCYSGATLTFLWFCHLFLYRDCPKHVLGYCQRVLEHCDDESTQNAMMEEIMQSVVTLTEDQYGNYVIQVTVYSFHVPFLIYSLSYTSTSPMLNRSSVNHFSTISCAYYLTYLTTCGLKVLYYDQVF